MLHTLCHQGNANKNNNETLLHTYLPLFSRSVESNSSTPRTAACQASLSFTVSRSSLKLMSIGSVMPSNHLILRHPLLLLPPILLSIRILSNELPLPIRWPKHCSPHPCENGQHPDTDNATHWRGRRATGPLPTREGTPPHPGRDPSPPPEGTQQCSPLKN